MYSRRNTTPKSNSKEDYLKDLYSKGRKNSFAGAGSKVMTANKFRSGSGYSKGSEETK